MYKGFLFKFPLMVKSRFLLRYAGILWDKTMDDKLMHLKNYDTKTSTFIDENYSWKNLNTSIFLPANQDLKEPFKAFT